jgi:microcystin-dependent protein
MNVVRINKTLDVSGDTTMNVVRINKTLDVSGDTTLNNTKINGTLDVSGDTKFNNLSVHGTLDVSGDTTLNNTKINGTLDVSGATSLHDVLIVDGKTVLNSTLYVSDTTSLNNTTVRGNLDICGNTNIDGTLDVSGDTGIRGNLDVSGSIKVYGTLDVSGYNVYKELAYLNNNAAIVGTITMFGGSTAPTGWLLCQGGSYASATYPELFAVIGTTFGTAGPGLFNVPDLTQRFPYGKGVAAIPALGATGGSATITDVPAHSHTLTNGTAIVSSTQPAHDHSFAAAEGGAGAFKPFFTAVDTAPGYQHTVTTTTAQPIITSTISGSTNSYGSASVSILPPYITLNYIICYTAKTAAH